MLATQSAVSKYEGLLFLRVAVIQFLPQLYASSITPSIEEFAAQTSVTDP
jgi:hypothetical protein